MFFSAFSGKTVSLQNSLFQGATQTIRIRMKKRTTLFFLSTLACFQLTAQCNPDTEPPKVVAVNNLLVPIFPSKLATCWAVDLLDTLQDNCTPTNQIQFAVRKLGEGLGFPTNPVGDPDLAVTFDCCDLGTQFVELWARDAVGNTSLDTALIIIYDNAGDICEPCPPKITGCAYTLAGVLVDEMRWDLSHQHPAIPSFFDFDNCVELFAFYLYDATIIPSKDKDHLNGVSTYDLVLINKHILGLQPFNSPYQLIAADANNSRSVSTFDIVELRKLILGIYTELPANSSWRFIPKDFPFSDPTNPFADNIPEDITFLNIQTNILQADFTGIKIGDVSGNANPDSLMASEERAELIIQLEDVFLQAGQTARIPLHLGEALDLQGLQFALEFNPSVLEISGLSFSDRLTSSQPLTSSETYFAQPRAGLLTFSWNALKAPQIPTGEAVIFLDIKALQPVQVSEALRLQAERLRPELYTAEGASHRLQLDFLAAPKIGQTQLFPATPNPSSGAVRIPMALAENAVVLLEIFDLNGRRVYRQEQVLLAGLHGLEVPAEVFRGLSGVLFYRVVAGDFVGTDKLVRE